MTTAVAVRTPAEQITRNLEEDVEVSTLIERSYAAFNELYEAGDFERFPWLESNLSKVEQIADSYSPEKLHGWLSSLYKRYRSAKRGDAAQAIH